MIEKTQSQFKLLLPDAVESTPPHPPSIPADTEQQSGTLADIPMLLREFWDNRRQLTAASARGNALEEELKSIGVPYYAWKMNQGMSLTKLKRHPIKLCRPCFTNCRYRG